MPSRSLLLASLALFPLLALGAQDSLVTRAFVAARSEVSLRDGRLAGAGGELIRREASAALATFVGEDHGVAELPGVVAALLRDLRPAGYTHFVAEVSPFASAGLDALAGPGARTRLAAHLDRWLNAAPFFNLREELDLLGELLSPAGALRPMHFVGLDYDVFGDRAILRRLAAISPPGAQPALKRSIAVADSGWIRASTKQEFQALFGWSAPDSIFTALRAAIHPVTGSEAARLLDLLASTAATNRAYLAGRGFESNTLRARYMRQRQRDAGLLAMGSRGAPRALYKFGSVHAMRGTTSVRTLDIGTEGALAAERAGGHSYHLLVIAGPRTAQAQFDPVTLAYAPDSSATIDDEEWAAVRAALPERGWVYFDLAAVRRTVWDGRVRGLPARLEPLMLGYDGLLVLVGSTPSTGITPPRDR